MGRKFRVMGATAALVGLLATSLVTGAGFNASAAPVGQGFTVTPSDLAFILKQIKIAEHHSATYTPENPCGTLVGPGPDQIPDYLSAYGLRTVDGSCNNLIPGNEKFSAADVPFPRLTTPVFRDAEPVPPGFGPPGPTSYAQKKGLVFDSQPRVISNLIVDQTSTNPAAVAAAEFPVRTQGNPGLFPCTTDPDPTANPPVAGVPVNCVPSHQTLFIPNVTTDVGLSPPYNSLFTFFGQFFDHGVDQTVKSGGTVFVPLHADDPLVVAGPDGIPGNGDEVPPSQAFMVLTRAQNQPGPDGILIDDPATAADETADNVQDANNTDTPWVDQSQTYTSHSSHQVFLREYVNSPAGKPVSTGKLLGPLTALDDADGAATTGAISTWASTKAQAANLLGLLLQDKDVTNIPMMAADPYGNFIPGPNGLPQYVTTTGLVEGNIALPVPVPANVLHFDTPFLTDIAHNADPGTVGPCSTTGNAAGCLEPDADTTASADFASQPAGTYDDEMLNAHFTCGDGRCNENIALSTIHQIFHHEHDRLVDDIKNVLTTDTSASGVAALAEWQPGTPDVAPDGWNGQRLFQAARFITEMQYQHLVFEEFGRKIQPAIRPFHVYSTDINAAIPAEFAHAVYRFGHSMLDDDVARTNVDPTTGAKTDNSLPLLTAFLNPPEYFNGHAAGTLTPEQAAGSVVMGSSDQIGNELDEFVVETLRNNLLGLPLDLPTLNMTRARDAGIPPLNDLRRQIFGQTNDGQLAPYTSWSDFGQHLKHPQSLINFVAAYGTHPSITTLDPDGPGPIQPGDLKARRAAANQIVLDRALAVPTGIADNPTTTTIDESVTIVEPPADASDFMFSTPGSAWESDADGVTNTGLDSVDLWVGGLAEVTNLFGGLLGTTFNYVFQTSLENLQDGDRLYYLNRTPGMNLRSQLEGNSFAELIMRNTDGTSSLKADAFATADCKFELADLTFPATAAGSPQTPSSLLIIGASSVNDDPATTDCDENQLLLRKPDGTIQYRSVNSVDPVGINGQSVYNGTPGVDRIFGGNDNDTFWGGLGNDVIEGNGGDDVALGGEGNDVITDLGGADVEKGGPGNDALDGGIGDDIFMGGDGQDFINGGSNDNEAFAGPGNDFVIAGQGADAVLGDGGDDWIEGGSGQDLLIGDHSAPFFDDPAQVAPGNDVFVGQVGENDYDAEGGDDVMAQNSAVDRNAGAGGFDWAFHQYNTVKADDDMEINNNLVGVPIQVVVNRDRWQETEADSGAAFDDIIKGTSVAPATVGGAGFTGCDVLDQAGVDRISGLAAILPQPLTGDPAPVIAASASGYCPISGPIWGEGDILIGGAGSDTITGRGADDVIDGDRYLHTRISVRTNPADPASEIGTTDLMEHAYKAGSTRTLQQDVFAGLVDPGNLVAVREILTPIVPEPGLPGNIDTAVFSGPIAGYVITPNANGSITVSDAAGAAVDGTDTLFNIERLQFTDRLLNLFNHLPTGSPVINPATPQATLPVTAVTTGIADLDGLVGVTFHFQWLLNGTTNVGTDSATFTPTPAMVGSTLRVRVTFTDQGGTPETLTSAASNPIIAAPAPIVVLSATSLAFGTRSTVAGPTTQSITIGNTGAGNLNIGAVTRSGANQGSFTVGAGCTNVVVTPGSSCTINVTFNSTTVGAKTAQISIASNAPAPIVIPFTANVVVNSAPTGTPAVSSTTPQNGVLLTATLGTVADADGIPATVNFRWQQSNVGGGGAFANIALATSASFTPGPAQLGRALRVVVSYTDNHGTAQTVNGATSALVFDVFVGTPADDTWTGNAGNDIANGAGGNDTLSAAAGDDLFTFTGNAEGFDAINGNGGIDQISATADGTVIGLRSIAGVETVSSGGFSNVTISGSAAANTLNFSAVTLAGIVSIDGGAGNDNITGSAAADNIIGGGGNDTMNGGAGNDVFRYFAGFGADTINGFDADATGGQDLIDISFLGVTSANFSGLVGLTQVGGNVRVSIGGNTITLIGQVLANITIADFIVG
jgi:Ca2+-binding RTX toxin-like protein